MKVGRDKVQLQTQRYVQKPDGVVCNKCATRIATKMANALVKGSIAPNPESAHHLRHSLIVNNLRMLNAKRVEKAFQHVEDGFVSRNDIVRVFGDRGYGAGVGEALVEMVDALHGTSGSDLYEVEVLIDVADHAHGVLQLLAGLRRMDEDTRRKTERATSAANFVGKHNIRYWGQALGYRARCKHLQGHAKWILRRFGSVRDFCEHMNSAFEERDGALRFV